MLWSMATKNLKNILRNFKNTPEWFQMVLGHFHLKWKFLIFSDRKSNFWSFLSVFDRFWVFLIVLIVFDRFRVFLIVLSVFDCFWSFLTISECFRRVLLIISRFGTFWNSFGLGSVRNSWKCGGLVMECWSFFRPAEFKHKQENLDDVAKVIYFHPRGYLELLFMDKVCKFLLNKF